MRELISVIIPTYNRANYLGRTLQSVVMQKYRPLEVLVIDDGSTDDTPQLIAHAIEEFKLQDIELIYQRQTNAGPGHARNVALQQARGQFVAFIDSDDVWRPGFCSTLHQLLVDHPSAGLAFCAMDVMDADDRIWTHRSTGQPSEPRCGLMVRPFDTIIDYMPMGTPGIMMRREVAQRMGFFDTSYRVGEDWDLWYRVAREHDFVYTNDALTICREHPHNTPKEDAAAWADRVRLSLRHLPMVKAEAARKILIARIRAETLLFVEQLLREGKGAGCESDRAIVAEVRDAGFESRSLRFQIATLLANGPRAAGRWYAKMIRAVGNLRRKKAA